MRHIYIDTSYALFATALFEERGAGLSDRTCFREVDTGSGVAREEGADSESELTT